VEDRSAGRGGAGIGIGIVGGPRAIGRLHQTGRVVGKPASEGVAGSGVVEFGEDALAECGDRVSGR